MSSSRRASRTREGGSVQHVSGSKNRALLDIPSPLNLSGFLETRIGFNTVSSGFE